MKKLREAHKEFIDNLKSKKRASATVLAYGKDIEQLVGFLEDLQKANVHEATADDIRSFLAKMEKSGYTKKSISRKLNSTKIFFRFLKVREYITDDPANLVDHPRFETKPPRILSPIEYRALRDAARDDARIAAIIEVLLQTGIRIGELANLKVEDVFWGEEGKEGTIYISPSLPSSPQKTSSTLRFASSPILIPVCSKTSIIAAILASSRAASLSARYSIGERILGGLVSNLG